MYVTMILYARLSLQSTKKLTRSAAKSHKKEGINYIVDSQAV
jgi:hypothetical protein